MRRWSVILFSLIVSNAYAMFPTVVHFNDATGKQLTIGFHDETKPLEAENECKSPSQPCTDMYWIEHRVKGGKRIEIDEAVVDHSENFGNPEVRLVLHERVEDPSDLVLVVSDLMVINPATGKPKSAGWTEFPLVPQLEQREDRERPTLRYQSLLPGKMSDTPAERTAVASNLTVTDPDFPTRRYDVYVRRIKSESDYVHDFEVAGLPRSRKAKVAYRGTFNDVVVPVKMTLTSPAIPKNRDEAAFYVNASAESDDIAREQTYRFDTKIAPAWRTRSWEIGPRLEATVGNATSKAPNTASLAADFRYWFLEEADGALQSHALVFAPTYRTDRKFDNRDGGLDVTWEPYFTHLENKTLEVRRAREKREGGVPQSIHWGYRIRTKIGAEYGRHIDSTSPQLNDDEYSRLRGEVVAMVEWQQLRLTVTAQTRHLFSHELLLDENGGVVTISDSMRNHVRAELAYDLGAFAISVTHLNGRVPPAFSPTHSTALGLTLKF